MARNFTKIAEREMAAARAKCLAEDFGGIEPTRAMDKAMLKVSTSGAHARIVFEAGDERAIRARIESIREHGWSSYDAWFFKNYRTHPYTTDEGVAYSAGDHRVNRTIARYCRRFSRSLFSIPMKEAA